MTVYAAGHVKRDPETNAVAVRTIYPEDAYPDSAWLVATISAGATSRPASYVDGWDDLFTPSS